MRLIDASELIQLLCVNMDSGEQFNIATHCVDVMPTVDAVEVIRCKDCKHSYETLPTVYRYLMCSHGVCVDCIVDEDFYCAMAERKEE